MFVSSNAEIKNTQRPSVVARNRIHQSTGYTRLRLSLQAFYLFLCWNVAWKFHFNILKRGSVRKFASFAFDIVLHKLCTNRAIGLQHPREKFFPLESVSVFNYLWSTSPYKGEKGTNGLSPCQRRSHITIYWKISYWNKNKTHVCMTISV